MKTAKAAGITTGSEKNSADFWAEFNRENNKINRNGARVLFRKELADHIESKRCWILFMLFLLVSSASLRGAVDSISSAAQQASAQGQTLTDFIFLSLFTTGGSSIYSFATFIGFLGPILGIMLGFDAINNETAQGTLNRLAAQPVYRDTIIRAKFLAAAAVIFGMVFAIGVWFTGSALIISGIRPHAEEFARIAVFLLSASVYVCVWLSISILFSTLSSHAATSALGCIALWLFLTMFLSLIATALAGLFIPVSGSSATIADALRNYDLSVAINRISPYYLFNEITQVLMNPNVRSLNLMSVLESQQGAVTSYLSFGQSVLQIWPQIVAMTAETIIGFAAAYICFMNREIRA